MCIHVSRYLLNKHHAFPSLRSVHVWRAFLNRLCIIVLRCLNWACFPVYYSMTFLISGTGFCRIEAANTDRYQREYHNLGWVLNASLEIRFPLIKQERPSDCFGTTINSKFNRTTPRVAAFQVVVDRLDQNTHSWTKIQHCVSPFYPPKLIKTYWSLSSWIQQKTYYEYNR